MGYYSSEATITAKVNAARIKLWADRDRSGAIDPATLTAALTAAKAIINAKIRKVYGIAVESWNLTNCDPLLCAISDDLTLFYLASGSNAISPVIENNFVRAMDLLNDLSAGKLDLTVDGSLLSISSTDSAPIHVDNDDANTGRIFERISADEPKSLYA